MSNDYFFTVIGRWEKIMKLSKNLHKNEVLPKWNETIQISNDIDDLLDLKRSSFIAITVRVTATPSKMRSRMHILDIKILASSLRVLTIARKSRLIW